MNIAVIGAGAIGMLLSGYLSETVHQVTLYTRTKEQARELKEKGLFLDTKELQKINKVKTGHFPDLQLTKVDLLIITVKQYDLVEILNCLKYKTKNPLPSIMFVQNGMGHLSLLESLCGGSISVGIIEHGALKVSSNHVIHNGNGNFILGPFRGDESQLVQLSSSLTEVGFTTSVTKNWRTIMENKLIVNACINPLTALFNVNNGKLISNPHLFSLMYSLFEEACVALALEDKQKLWESVVNIAKITSHNRSSMLRDIESKKHTENDAISGYILERGNKNELPYTRFVYESIKAIELERGE